MKQQSIEALKSAIDYLTRMDNAVPDIIKSYRNGELIRASNDMVLLAEGLQWLNEILYLTKAFHKVDSFELKELYLECIEALENNDNVLIADLLEYELIPKIHYWKNSISETLAQNAN